MEPESSIKSQQDSEVTMPTHEVGHDHAASTDGVRGDNGIKKRKKKKKKDKKLADKINDAEKLKRMNVKLEPLSESVTAKRATEVVASRAGGSGCFGFITSWWIKRKEKRREKKRKAIQDRNSRSPKPSVLVQHGHQKSRGGFAFSIELDDRPVVKPVLPPIKSRSETAKSDPQTKLENAQKKREEYMRQKLDFVRSQNEKRIEATERKADNERGFRQKAELTILAKQGQAKRNQSRMGMDRRCSSSMRRSTPRTVPISSGYQVENFYDNGILE